MKMVAYTASIAGLVCGASAVGQSIESGLATRMAEAVSQRDERALSKASRVLLVWTKTLTLEKFDYDVIEPTDLFVRLKGCEKGWVSEQYGEFQLVCKDRPTGRDNCLNEAISANVRRFPNGAVVRFQATDDWSVERCGKAPIFAPPPPPLPSKN